MYSIRVYWCVVNAILSLGTHLHCIYCTVSWLVVFWDDACMSSLSVFRFRCSLVQVCNEDPCCQQCGPECCPMTYSCQSPCCPSPCTVGVCFTPDS